MLYYVYIIQHMGVTDVNILQKHKLSLLVLSGILLLGAMLIFHFAVIPARALTIERQIEADYKNMVAAERARAALAVAESLKDAVEVGRQIELNYEKMTSTEEKRAALAATESLKNKDKTALVAVTIIDKAFSASLVNRSKSINGMAFEITHDFFRFASYENSEHNEYTFHLRFATIAEAEKAVRILNSMEEVKHAALLEKRYIAEHTLNAKTSGSIISDSQEKMQALEDLSCVHKEPEWDFMTSEVLVEFNDNKMREAFINNKYLFLNDMEFSVGRNESISDSLSAGVSISVSDYAISLQFKNVADATAAVYLLNSLHEVRAAQMVLFMPCYPLRKGTQNDF